MTLTLSGWAPPRWARSRRASAVLALVAVAAVVGVVAAVDPSVPGRYPSCPLHALTGLHCPGCGTVRGVHALATGRPVDALGLNPLMVVSLPYLALGWWRWARALPARVPPRFGWVVAAVVIGFGVARNLPFPPFDALRP